MIPDKSKYKQEKLVELDQILFPELIMKKNTQIIGKTFEFSLKVVELYIELLKSNEFDLSGKLLKSGTSIRENVEESLASLTREEILNGLSLASKQAVEARYWLKLIQMKHYVSGNPLDECVERLNEIINIINTMIRESDKNKFILNSLNLN